MTLNTKTTNIYQGRDGLNKTLREERVPVEDGVVLELLIGGERERWTRQNEAFEGNGELLGLHNYSATSSNPAVTPCQRQSHKWKNEMGKKENKQYQCVSDQENASQCTLHSLEIKKIPNAMFGKGKI